MSDIRRKILGFYSELWPSNPEATGSIRPLMAVAPQPNESDIASYLRGGHVLFASMGVVDDALGTGEGIVGGGSLLTDGEWLWRGDLWFYVSRHHLVLPADFRAKAASLGYAVPAVEQERLMTLTDELQALRSGKRK
ncbi:hypothetical protein [Streptomyces murinus]|uniref:Uncharacterized protein n=1 Tax=Streptomyces murinus TaxID=33900 RepID=A0A7W3NPH2_STRMR|nr:hypothetical protein [Streptomyces murinus]MBA9054263.1 hypothetical protein [Streptomyces murinus]UWW95283.1 hypothetical protein GO605_34025 [Streptomyces murinus]